MLNGEYRIKIGKIYTPNFELIRISNLGFFVYTYTSIKAFLSNSRYFLQFLKTIHIQESKFPSFILCL